MVDLDKETIETIRRLSDALKETPFDINRFDVGESGIGKTMITLDIRRREEKAEMPKQD